MAIVALVSKNSYPKKKGGKSTEIQKNYSKQAKKKSGKSTEIRKFLFQAKKWKINRNQKLPAAHKDLRTNWPIGKCSVVHRE